MEKRVIGFVLFLLVCGFVLAQDGWDEINVDDNFTNDIIQTDAPLDSVDGDVGAETVAPIVQDVQDVSLESGRFFTANFYIALGIVLGVLVVLGVFVWFWIRGPKNKWEE
ncbi:hypothetical protein HNV12_04310 [Methanococcoides sp. SA1]|nr:hypothetical protein [Methanococcoides sp. SA1]